MARHLLLIEDDPPILEIGAERLRADLDLCCDRASWGSFALESLRDSSAELLVPFVSGRTDRPQALFRWLKDHRASIPTLAVLSGGAGSDLVQTMLDAVDDFIVWPIRPEEWRQRLARMLRPVASVHDRITNELGLARLVGEDPAFLNMLRKIPVAARSRSAVLITGETGTGKELCARAIHHLSHRRHSPFIPVDCGALPDHLLENELFGHARGAYTDAGRDQKGLVALAEGGTLFLDEFDALSPPAQSKLLRFLQEASYKPLGADRFVHAEVRVIAATNREPEALVRQKLLRSDLYFRLNVLRLHLAPLRERRGDVALLARHFVESLCSEAGTMRKTLSPEALHKLALHDWPGNVRELLNVVQRAVLFSDAPLIQPGDVTTSSGGPDASLPARFREARARAIEAFEQLYVEDLMSRNGGNVTRAAREAGKERRAFGRLVKKYSLRFSL